MKWYSLFLSFCVGFTEEAKQKGRYVVLRLAIRCTTHNPNPKKGREGGIEGRNEETSRSVKIGEGRTRRAKGSRNGEMVMG